MHTVIFPTNRLSLANLPTSFRHLSRLSHLLGGPQIWLKHDDQTGSVLSGNKIRKLEFTLGHAISKKVDVVITCGAIQSNHCRATAIACAQLGLRCHLLLRGEKENHADANELLDSLAGANLSYYPQKDFASKLKLRFDEHKAHYEQQGLKVMCVPTGASDGVGLWGYIQASMELQNDFASNNISPSAVICASGSGGTQAGLTLGFALQGLNFPTIGMAVCDDSAYFMRKVKSDIQDWFRLYPGYTSVTEQFINDIAIHTNDQYIGEGYAKAYPEVIDAIQLVAETEGVILEPCYTGKAFYGLMQEIKAGRWTKKENVVFVHTGGVFGLFPYRDQFRQNN